MHEGKTCQPPKFDLVLQWIQQIILTHYGLRVIEYPKSRYQHCQIISILHKYFNLPNCINIAIEMKGYKVGFLFSKSNLLMV